MYVNIAVYFYIPVHTSIYPRCNILLTLGMGKSSDVSPVSRNLQNLIIVNPLFSSPLMRFQPLGIASISGIIRAGAKRSYEGGEPLSSKSVNIYIHIL